VGSIPTEATKLLIFLGVFLFNHFLGNLNMQWEFEHWDNGKVYLHIEKWNNFKLNVEKNGYNGYKHDWNHKRIFCNIHTPRKNLIDLPAIGEDSKKHKIEDVEEWTLIYDPFPAFSRTVSDPEGWLPSYNLWAEDNHKDGESVHILTSIPTGDIFYSPRNYFVLFRDMFWMLNYYEEYGFGSHKPPKKKKENLVRSIFEPFESAW